MQTNTVAALLRLGSVANDDWEGALQEILRLDSELLGIERVSFWAYQADAKLFCELGYVRSSRLFERGAVIGAMSPRYLEEIRKLQLIDADDARIDPRTRDLGAYLQAKDIGALLDVPVCTEGRVVGLLCHEHVGGVRHWTSRDQEFAVVVGQTLATMLETRARTRSEQAEQRAAFLSDVVPGLTEALGCEEVATLAVRHALPILGEMAILVTVEEGVIRHRAHAHVTAEGQRLVDELRRRYPVTLEGSYFISRAVREKQSLIVPVVRPEAGMRFGPERGFAELVARLNVRSAMALPLMFRGQLTGGVAFLSDHRTYGPDDLRFAEAYARQVGGILENARLYQQAQEAIRVRDEFLSLASHELRTPLTSLRAATEVIVRESAAPEASAGSLSRMGEIIARQVDHLDRLSARILDASEIIAGLSLRREGVDLAEVTRATVTSFADDAKRRGSQLTVHTETPVVGEWDRVRLEQVVTNLLDNAIKFGAGRPIEVSTQLRNGSALLSVRDRGIGIPREQLDRLFERYHRGVSAQSFGGLGLGLYLVRRIVEAHGGTVHVDSYVEQGATFTVELPVSVGDARASPRDG